MNTFAFIRNVFLSASLGYALIFSLPTQATEQGGHNMNHGSAMSSASAADTEYQATGTIKRWNTNDVSITHDPITQLGWPMMTMSFSLPENNTLQALPEGSKVVFSFRETQDGYQLTQINPATR